MKWIKTSEQLPPINTTVLLFIEYSKMATTGEYIYTLQCFNKHNRMNGEVTHWAKIELPK